MIAASVKALMPAILLPAILVRDGPHAGDEPERAANHAGRLDAIQRIALVQQRREQHRQRGLVELHALPIRRAVEPLILIPVAVLVLSGDEVAQHVARLGLAADAEQRHGALDEIARPDQVIPAAVVAANCPTAR